MNKKKYKGIVATLLVIHTAINIFDFVLFNNMIWDKIQVSYQVIQGIVLVIAATYLFCGLYKEMKNNHNYEWRKNKKWIVNFFFVFNLCFLFLIFIFVGDIIIFILMQKGTESIICTNDQDSLQNLHDSVKFGFLQGVDLTYYLIFFIIILLKSPDDIFDGISKLDHLYKVSCFQVYKSQKLF